MKSNKPVFSNKNKSISIAKTFIKTEKKGLKNVGRVLR